jgi:predicted DNA-binding transcriptional regulator AlpA
MCQSEFLARLVTERLIRISDVVALTGIPKTTLYRLMSQGKFPKPQKFGRASYWKLSEVKRFLSDPGHYSPALPQDEEGSPPANRGSLDLERTSAEDSRA